MQISKRGKQKYLCAYIYREREKKICNVFHSERSKKERKRKLISKNRKQKWLLPIVIGKKKGRRKHRNAKGLLDWPVVMAKISKTNAKAAMIEARLEMGYR